MLPSQPLCAHTLLAAKAACFRLSTAVSRASLGDLQEYCSRADERGLSYLNASGIQAQSNICPMRFDVSQILHDKLCEHELTCGMDMCQAHQVAVVSRGWDSVVPLRCAKLSL